MVKGCWALGRHLVQAVKRFVFAFTVSVLFFVFFTGFCAQASVVRIEGSLQLFPQGRSSRFAQWVYEGLGPYTALNPQPYGVYPKP